MKKAILITAIISYGISLFSEVQAQPAVKLKKKDYRSDIRMVTDSGTLILRLNDSTPSHRNNFLSLVKNRYYDGISFHRIISGFMIQAGDEKTKKGADSTKFLAGYTLAAEIRPDLFHKKGVLAAARLGDNVNPTKASSGVQFYIVQGRIFNDKALDSVETYRMNGRKIPAEQRTAYKTIGGSPHLDQQYTIFGELISGFDVLDKIAGVKTTGRSGGDKPIRDIRIKKVRLTRRIT
jgi:peptidyl-prolyl cis-trans isomerase B (cyclophilin B)